MQKIFLPIILLFSFHAILAQQTITFDFHNSSESETPGFSETGNITINEGLDIQFKNIAQGEPIEIVFNDINNVEFATITRSELDNAGLHNTDFTINIFGASIARFPDKALPDPFTVTVRHRDIEKQSSVTFSFDAIPPAPPPTGRNDLSGSDVNLNSDGVYRNVPGKTELFKDAVSINYYLTRNTNKVVEVMKDYFPSSQEPVNWSDLHSRLAMSRDDTLLYEVFKLYEEVIPVQVDEEAGPATTKGTSTSFLTSPSILIDALARLIARRFKEELNIAYMRKFRAALSDHHIDKLLPQTYTVLTFQDPVNYKSYFSLLREALHNDYVNSGNNLYSFASQEDIKNLINNSTVYTAMMSGLYIFKRRADLPADIVEEALYEEFIEDNLIRDHIEFLATLSKHLRASATYTGWIEAEELGRLAEGHTFQIFAGLFFLHEANNLKNNAVLKKLKMDSGSGPIKFFNIYKSILDLQVAIEDLELKLNNNLSDEQKVEAQITRAEKLHYVLTKLLELAKYVDESKSTDLARVNVVLDQSLGLIRSGYQKAYGNIIHSLVTIIDTLGFDFGDEFMKYSSFAISLLNAQNTEEAYLALETAAMPVGGYRVKRKSSFSVTLGGYPGLFGAAESFSGNTYSIAENAFQEAGQSLDRTGLAWGFTSPVGISFDWGNTEEEKDIPPSFSIFLSVIDIGSVVSFRLQDNTSILPELKWSNVIAPGLQVAIGLKNSPLSINAGFQYGPDLRELSLVTTEDGTNFIESTFGAQAWRAGVSCVVDVSLFNLHAR